ncbi:MAG: hypothetical protein RLZZ245_2404, partial [Verrucomicrobiota bacterium]
TFRYNSSAAQTLDGAISGAGTLMKNASSTLTLGGTNPSFSGAIEINAGTLNLANTGALGSAASISIAGGATLASQTTGLSIAVPITLGASVATSTISFGRNSPDQGTFSLNESISGSANLTFTTPNVNSSGNLQTIFLGSANNYAGNTTITTGNSGNALSVKATYADVLPATTVLTLNGGSGTGSGRTVTFDLNGFDQTIAGLTNNISTLTARNQRINNSSADRATLTIQNSADFTFGGTGISSTYQSKPVNPTAQITGNLDLIKMGPGKFTLAAGAGNTFSGTTTVLEGILSLGHPTSLQNSPFDTLGSVTGDSANGLQTTVSTLTLGGLVGDKNLAAIFTTGTYSNLATLTLNPGAGAAFDYSGIIADGTAGMTLIKTGAGTQTLAGPNTYTGATTVSAGTLALGANHVLPDATSLSIGNATLNVATFTNTAGTLDITGTATLQLDVGAALAFVDSSAIHWTGGTLNLIGSFVSGSSLRFGSTSDGLTPDQLAQITLNGAPASFSLNASGYLVQSAYAAWKSVNAPNTGSDPNADEDGDGVANGVEYVLGGTISSNDLPWLPQVSTAGGHSFFTFVRDQKSIDGITTVDIQVGEILADWTTHYPVPATAVEAESGVTVQKDIPVAGKDTITLSLPVSSLTKFARLKVVP